MDIPIDIGLGVKRRVAASAPPPKHLDIFKTKHRSHAQHTNHHTTERTNETHDRAT